jgi:cytochrome c-type biogenesis protein CcmH/NrfG
VAQSWNAAYWLKKTANPAPDTEIERQGYHLLEQAVAAEPTLARAWVDLAYVRQSEINYADPASVLPAAEDAAQCAIALDPTNARAHAALARILGMRGDLGPVRRNSIAPCSSILVTSKSLQAIRVGNFLRSS